MFVTRNTENMTTELSRNIKILRESNRLSQAELADIVGVQREVISYYETGTREVSLEVLEKLADFFDVELDVFFEEKEENVKADFALAFRANELEDLDVLAISRLKRIVRNVRKMQSIQTK